MSLPEGLPLHPACALSLMPTVAGPAEEWVFLPPTVSPPPATSPPTPSHLPTPFSSPLPPGDNEEGLNPRLYGILQLFAAEYFTTALGIPFEVGKTLLQIEYRPRRKYDPPLYDETIPAGQRDWGAEDDEVSYVQFLWHQADKRSCVAE